MNTSRPINLRFTLAVIFCALFLLAADARSQSGPPLPPPVPVAALSFWPLEASPWENLRGEPARAFTNLDLAPSWDYEGAALSISTNMPAFLQLNVFEGGKPVLNLTNGSLEIWCAPYWTSMADSGTGPMAWASIWDIGCYTTDASIGAWLMAVDPSGSNLVWLAQSGGSNQMLWTGINFDAGDFHEVVATWSSSNSCLYVDGGLATNSGPILYRPSSLECSNDGFCVGSLSAASGTNQFQGQLQWLVSYAYPLSAGEVADEYADVAAYITSFGYNVPGSGGGYSDDSPPFPGGGYTNGSTNSFTNDFIRPVYTTNSPIAYDSHTNLWLSITNDSSNCYVTAESTLSNLTYLILTNSQLATTNWSVWEVLLATSNVTPAPPLALGSNTLFFEAVMVGSTGTNGLPDWWCMEYFGTLNVDPYADPDGDGLCNWSEFMLGTNPTNAYSVSTMHKDAQAKFLAYTNDPACVYQLFVTNGSDTNTLLVTMWPALVGSNYQIYSQTSTNAPWIMETNFFGTNTATTITIALNGRTLSLIGGYGEDDDGDGLPDGYEVLATLTDPLLADTGNTGTPDGYKDLDGDGYVNLQEYFNGTNPHVFDAPSGPPWVGSIFTNDNTSLIISWQAASGPVLGYVIYAWNPTNDLLEAIATNSPSQLTYLLNDLGNYDYPTYANGDFGIQAIYALTAC